MARSRHRSSLAKARSLIRREKTILFPVLMPTRTAPSIFYIFLVDIKVALGNNPHLFFFFLWNLHVVYVIRLQYFGAQR